MGQSLAKAVDEKGRKVKDASWSGWIHIYKIGLIKRGYKRRYCRLDRDRLYYFADDKPKHTSKGCIHLHDVTGIASLPSHTQDQLPVALITPAIVYMLVFESIAIKESLDKALRPSIPRSAIVAEDWSIVQLEHSQSKDTHFVRYYIVFVTSGDLLFFTDGDCRFLEARVRMVDLENVLVGYDTAAGNGIVLSPRSQARAAASMESPSIQLIVLAKCISLEFDAKAKYELWRELLVDAAAGDYYGRAFLQRRLLEEQRKKWQRQAKLDDMLKKTKKLSKHKKTTRQTLHDQSVWRPSTASSRQSRFSHSDATYDVDDLSEISTMSFESAVTSVRSKTKSETDSTKTKKKKKKKTPREEDGTKQKKKTTRHSHDSNEAEERTTKAIVPVAAHEQELETSPERKPKALVVPTNSQAVLESQPLRKPPALVEVSALATEPRPHRKHKAIVQTEEAVASMPHPRKKKSADVNNAPKSNVDGSSSTALVVAPKKSNRVREDIFASSPLSSPTFQEKKQALLQKLQAYSPLSPKKKVEATAFVPEPIPAPSRGRRRQRSITSNASAKALLGPMDKHTDLSLRHELLQADFQKLCSKMASSNPKQSKRLQRQIQACAQAIDTLGGLVMFPPQQETIVPPILPQLASNRPVGCVDVEGGWYTMQQKGGFYVRHWKPLKV